MGHGDDEPKKGSDDPRLKALGERLAEARRETSGPADGLQSTGLSGIGQALRVGSELVAGVVVGFVIGYTIDQVFGSKPWGMIVFLLLGFVAGTLNVLRAVGMARDPYAAPADRKDDDGK